MSEREHADHSGDDLRVDVLKVAHHGSSRQLPEFIRATHAPLALISVGADNDYGHPAPAALRMLADAQMMTLRTDQRGAIAVLRNASGLAYAVSGVRR